MSDFKVGPCTLTSKDGKSKLVGKIEHDRGEGFEFRIDGASGSNVLYKANWTPDYPLPPLPTQSGTVIDVGDRRALRLNRGEWALTYSEEACSQVVEHDTMLEIVKRCGGFTVVLEGKAE